MKGLSKLPLKPLDFVAVGLSVLLTLSSAFFVYAKPKETAHFVIHGSGRVWVFPMDADETIDVQGPLGTTVVRVHGGDAWVEDSPCDNRTCVAAGHIHEQGQWIACLPNNVFVLVEGSEDGGKLDASTW